jgi:hypothetical protein
MRRSKIEARTSSNHAILSGMDHFQVIADGMKFAVKITFHSGRIEIKRGFDTEVEAELWMEVERAKSASSAFSPPSRNL